MASNTVLDTLGQEWPEGVTARYLTVAGALVDVEEVLDERATVASCNGCHHYDTTDWEENRLETASRYDARAEACEWAQQHAEKCRALPRPGRETR